ARRAGRAAGRGVRVRAVPGVSGRADGGGAGAVRGADRARAEGGGWLWIRPGVRAGGRADDGGAGARGEVGDLAPRGGVRADEAAPSGPIVSSLARHRQLHWWCRTATMPGL